MTFVFLSMLSFDVYFESRFPRESAIALITLVHLPLVSDSYVFHYHVLNARRVTRKTNQTNVETRRHFRRMPTGRLPTVQAT